VTAPVNGWRGAPNVRTIVPLQRDGSTPMTASPIARPLAAAGTRPVTPDGPTTELRRLLLAHLALDVRPSQLATVVVTLCAAIGPMLSRSAVSVGTREPLSDREVQVLVGMAGGSSNAQIGRALHISEDTVKTYARRLYTNLGVRDRAHAVSRGYQCGILVVGDTGVHGDGPRPLHDVHDGLTPS